ncbi:hypothetical protein AAMO2058_001052800 [Amorphochlora amoebiformis]
MVSLLENTSGKVKTKEFFYSEYAKNRPRTGLSSRVGCHWKVANNISISAIIIGDFFETMATGGEIKFVEGSVVKILGITDKQCSREALQDAFGSCGKIEYTDYNRGGDHAYLRMSSANEAKKAVELWKTSKEGLSTLGQLKVEQVVGEEEKKYLAKIAKHKEEMRKQRTSKKGKKRGREEIDESLKYKCTHCEKELSSSSFSKRQLLKRSNRSCKTCVDKNHNEYKTKRTKADLTCKICADVFTSRNKLFQHIRKEGHDAGENKSEEASKADTGVAPQAKKAKVDES